MVRGSGPAQPGNSGCHIPRSGLAVEEHFSKISLGGHKAHIGGLQHLFLGGLGVFLDALAFAQHQGLVAQGGEIDILDFVPGVVSALVVARVVLFEAGVESGLHLLVIGAAGATGEEGGTEQEPGRKASHGLQATLARFRMQNEDAMRDP